MTGIILIVAFATLFIAPLVISKCVRDPEANKKWMNIYCIFFLTSFIWIPALISVANSMNKGEAKADGFTLEGYEVILDVGIDNKVQVTENIDVNFYESGHHGIYKFTPYWLEYTGSDGKTIKRKSNILNLSSELTHFTVDTVNKKQRIKLGHKSFTVYGDKKYTIKDPFKGFDEFIFHAFGDFWGTEIKNPKIVVNMPKDVSNYTVNVFTDKYRKENVNGLVNKEINGNTITITADTLHLFKSLTVDVELPEGYFEGGSWNYGWISFICSIIVIILTLYVICAWYKHGKDYEKRIPTVEFYASDGLSSAEVGYIYNRRHVSKKLTISLILQLASKGYVKINELKDNHNKIQISKVNVAPTKPTLPDGGKHIVEIEKIKEADSSLNNSAAHFMEKRFKNANTEQISGNTLELFTKYKDELITGGYIRVISDNEKETIEAFEKSGYNKKVAAYEKELEKYQKLLSKMPEKTALENIVYGNLFSSKDEVILSEHKTFYKTFGQVEKELKDSFRNKIHEDASRKYKKKALIISLITLVLSLLSFFYFEDMDPSWSILYYVSFVCALLNIFFTFIMGRKTEYGEDISARVKGFRDFLITAEKDKLEALVSENPNYFYDILPYTYVLNISKKWVNKFEDIKLPEVDMGNYNYSSDTSFHSIFNDVYYPVSTSSGSHSGSSGCSSCGGGCSSCGGGCSSCGGGGSW